MNTETDKKEKLVLPRNSDFVISKGNRAFVFVSEIFPKGSYIVRTERAGSKSALFRVTGGKRNIVKGPLGLRRRPVNEFSDDLADIFAAAIYLDIIRGNSEYRKAYSVDPSRLQNIRFCFGRNFKLENSVPLTDVISEDLYNFEMTVKGKPGERI